MCEWFERSFGQDYLLVYKHRDLQGAYEEVRKMIGWLRLAPGARVLDLCCGMGRHSQALADAGYEVTGVDLSETLLDEARKSDREGRIRWLSGDMRRLPLDSMQFDAVVNLFTSFGYFEEDGEHLQVLREMKRVLKPGGQFIIDYLNSSYVERHLVPFSEREEDGVTITEKRRIEDGYVKKTITISDKKGGKRQYLERVKLYRLPQFTDMLQQAELRAIHVYGSYDEMPYDEALSPRMIFVGQAD